MAHPGVCRSVMRPADGIGLNSKFLVEESPPCSRAARRHRHPMFEDGISLDLHRLRALIDFHIREGTNGIVVVGNHRRIAYGRFCRALLLIRTAIEHAGRTRTHIAGHRWQFQPRGNRADGFSQAGRSGHVPVGRPLLQQADPQAREGLYRHFRAIAEAVDLPLFYTTCGPDGRRHAERTACGSHKCRISSAQGCNGQHGARSRAGCGARRKNFAYTAAMMAPEWTDDARRQGVIQSPPKLPTVMQEILLRGFWGGICQGKSHNNRMLGCIAPLCRGQSDYAQVGTAAKWA